MRRSWIQFGDLRIVKSSFVIIVLSPSPLSKSLFRFVTKSIQFPFTELLTFKIPFYICDEKYTSFQKALFKVPKICNINFWIENEPPPFGTKSCFAFYFDYEEPRILEIYIEAL